MKTRITILLLLTLLPALAGATQPKSAPGAQADTRARLQEQLSQLQAQMADLMQRMGEMSARVGDNARASAFRYLADPDRGMLGLAMQPDEDGLRIVAVSPNAPADRAGLEVGDIITSIDDRSVALGDNQDPDALDDLSAGKPVAIEILRNGKTQRLSVTPERRQPGDWAQVIRAARLSGDDLQRMQVDIQKRMEDARARIANAQDHAWLQSPMLSWNLGLTTLNPELGAYFGIDHGALVLSAGAESYPELNAGDVITSVDGHQVERAEDVMRMLGRSGNDDQVRIALRRHGKNMTLDMEVPSLQDLFPPPPPPPPAPPAPRTPPAPAAPPIPTAPPAPPPAPAPAPGDGSTMWY